ncbi:MAG: peptidylprolyl isomerase [Candidatus Omnitrophica bacterium]|nr:peptidylprolyl isomerase [Candidatus Omnitrophota bacterium]
MNRKVKFFAIFWMGALILTAGCARQPSDDDKVLATVSNKSITLKDFKSRIAKLPSYYKNIVEKNRKRFLDETIMEMLFYEEAVRQSLDRDREVKDVINEARKKILIAKLIKNEVEDKIKIGEDEAKRFYELHKDDFKSQELWRASHILVATEKEAGDILNELSNGASFEELARSRSMDATAARGGDVGYFRMGQLVPDFEKACMKLEIGQTSEVVRTQFGYHIIKLTDKKEPAIEPYEKVKQAIEEELKRKKRSELFDKLVLNLKERYGVKIEEDVFKSLEALNEGKKAETK